jgi:hypothetical protein
MTTLKPWTAWSVTVRIMNSLYSYERLRLLLSHEESQRLLDLQHSTTALIAKQQIKRIIRLTLLWLVGLAILLFTTTVKD